MIFTVPHLAGAVAIVAACASCSQPHSDVVATNTEDTGDYTVVASRDGDVLNARVCVAEPRHADVVIDRLLQQLYSRGYLTIALDVYRRGGSIKRLVWVSGIRREESLTGAPPEGFCGTS